jgi:ATP-dependent DNA ligase
MTGFQPHPALLPRAAASLCHLATDWAETLPPGQWQAEEKVDGIRAIWLSGELVSREGSPIHGVGHITAELERLQRAYGRRMMFDGEFQVGSKLKSTMAHFQYRGRAGDAGELFLFDAVPLEEWQEDACTEPLTDRQRVLRDMVEGEHPSCVTMLPSSIVRDAAEVWGMADAMWSAGKEGLVLKAMDSLYRRQRDPTWLKVKELADKNRACTIAATL